MQIEFARQETCCDISKRRVIDVLVGQSEICMIQKTEVFVHSQIPLKKVWTSKYLSPQVAERRTCRRHRECRRISVYLPAAEEAVHTGIPVRTILTSLTEGKLIDHTGDVSSVSHRSWRVHARRTNPGYFSCSTPLHLDRRCRFDSWKS